MAQVSMNWPANNRRTSPPFIAEQFEPELLFPGGGRLDIVTPQATAGSFLAQAAAQQGVLVDGNGKIRIPAGTMVVRTATQRDGYTAPTAPATQAIVAGGTPTTGPDATALAAGTYNASVGTAVTGWRLATQADFDASGNIAAQTPAANTIVEAFLIAFDVIDAMANPNIELIRPQTLIFINWLPYWPNAYAIPNSGVFPAQQQYPNLAGQPLATTGTPPAPAISGVLWPANVQAAVRRIYQTIYGREVA